MSAFSPSSVSKRSSFSTCTHGSSRRCRASSSPSLVCSFSPTSSCSPAATHSSRVPIVWLVIVFMCESFLRSAVLPTTVGAEQPNEQAQVVVCRQRVLVVEPGAGLEPAPGLGPVTLLRELFRRFEEALDRGELVVPSPDGVDCQHRAGWSEVEELDAARNLLDQRTDDKADAAAFCDIAPDGRAGSVLVDLGLEAGRAAGGADRVVVAGRHLMRPQLQHLVAQACELDLLTVCEAMLFPNRDAHDLAPDRSLTDVSGIGSEGGERKIAVAVAEECGDITAEHLTRIDLEHWILLVQP